MKKYSLGIDIGGTKCAVLLGNSCIPQNSDDTFILEKRTFLTEPKKGLNHTLSRLYETIDGLIEEHRILPEEVVGIGVSCGGPLDHVKGVILNPPNLYGWNEVPIVSLLYNRYRIPSFLQNDADASALAEWRFGAARGCHNVVFLTFGTGMGAGLILDDKLYCGTNNMAGEVGHIRLEQNGPVGYGKAGSFEGFCSGGGIAQIARNKVVEYMQRGVYPPFCPDLSHLDEMDAKNIAEAATAGDPVALEIYKICGENLGRGLSVIVDILNPEIIVLGSIFERNSELIWPHAKRILEKEALPQSLRACKVVPAALGDSIGDYAALSVAFS